jgi:hypothetical protein
MTYPAEHFVIVHQRLLTKAARHMQHVELRRIGQGRVGREPQAADVLHWLCRLGEEAAGRVWEAGEHLERAREVDLVEPVEQ